MISRVQQGHYPVHFINSSTVFLALIFQQLETTWLKDANRRKVSHKGSELASNLLFQDDIKSFDLDKAMVDAYPEYCMLKKL
jgi:ribosomal protein S19E (S16A)